MSEPDKNREAQKILLAIPVLDFKLDIEVLGGVMAVMAGFSPHVRPYFMAGDSNIAHCRNAIAHYFINKTDCDTLVCVDSDIVFTLADFSMLVQQVADEQVAVAPYARKKIGMPPVDFGFGFVRLHRSCFEVLSSWEIEGREALHRYFLDGEMAVDFHYNGATPDGRWHSEDTGFFHWCHLAGVKLRKEPRTRLGHIGRFRYGYPDQTPGLISLEEGAQ